ncbi:MAG: hypothetical protein AB1798_12100 [Spirochaetota bacterium]
MQRIGHFYKEKILSLPKRSRREIEAPYHDSDKGLRIDQDLFGWRLYYTRAGRKTERFIECKSEEEARYLKVLIDVGIRELYVPKDNEYLKTILPELEELKMKTDKIIDDGVSGILSRKRRQAVRRLVYSKITQY